MSPRSITSERSWFAALALIAACGGGSAPEPPDPSALDRSASDTERPQNQTDQPAAAADPGYDGDRPVSGSDQPPLPRPPEPPQASGGRSTGNGGSVGTGGSVVMTGGRASGGAGRAGTTGGRAGSTGGRAGTGGSPVTPPPSGCTFDEGCECADLCATCLCFSEEEPIDCDPLCN